MGFRKSLAEAVEITVKTFRDEVLKRILGWYCFAPAGHARPTNRSADKAEYASKKT